jgi:Pentapeptide repeats (8 copies)
MWNRRNLQRRETGLVRRKMVGVPKRKRIPKGWRTLITFLATVTIVVAVFLSIWMLSQFLDAYLPFVNWEIVQAIIGIVTLAPIIWAVIRYDRIANDQRKAKHYQAWQAITGAQGKPGSGGRKTALEELHNDGESLMGVDLSTKAYLLGLTLPGADLEGANLEGAILRGANLRGADLGNANLKGIDWLNLGHILKFKDWRGAGLPDFLKDLELPEDATGEDMDRLGREWKPDKSSEKSTE